MNKSIENMELNLSNRIATTEDTDSARDIHHRAYRETITKQYGSWDETMQDDFFNKEWNPEKYQIIFEGESICGYFSVENKEDYIFLKELVLSPEYQGKGIGSKIIEELFRESKEKNIPVKLQVMKVNPAQHLYRRLGFKDIEETETHYKMEFNSSDLK